jgi:hypothetical protein
VLVDGERILSCLALAAQFEGRSITTIEGLASGSVLHPLQQAFIDHDGFQCGYAALARSVPLLPPSFLFRPERWHMRHGAARRDPLRRRTGIIRAFELAEKRFGPPQSGPNVPFPG